MVLRQKLEKPIQGYWDGGKKDQFDWEIEKYTQFTDQNGKSFVRVGSWSANFWFIVSVGKTIKQTLANAKRKLRYITKVPSTFEYADK